MSYNQLTNRFKKQFDPIERRKANRQRQWTLIAMGIVLALLIAMCATIVFLFVLWMNPAFRSFLA